MAYIISSGETSNGITFEDGSSMFVLEGGVANSTTMKNGSMWVSSGGIINSTFLYDNGYLWISSGGIANETTVYNNGDMWILSGGVTNSTTIVDGGNLWIYGIANSTTLTNGGKFYVSSGGTANSTTVNSGGSFHVSSGGTANSTTVNFGGSFHVSSGGTANETSVNSRGSMFVSSGGIADNISVNPGGSMFVPGGHTDNSFVSGYAAFIIVSSGGTADNTVTDTDGCLDVSMGGVANNTTAKGWLRIFDGGVANNTVVQNGTNGNGYGTYISSGGIANSTTINSSGRFYVFSGGTANSTTVNSGGSLIVSMGGTAADILEDGGFVSVANDAVVTFVPNIINDFLLENASATIHSGTTANKTTVGSGGQLHVFSGGSANSTTVNFLGNLYVSNGGTADLIMVSSGGKLYVSSNGTADHTAINSGGSLYVFSGGTANSITVDGGTLSVSSGGTATNIVWTPCEGHVTIHDGAVATFVSEYSGVYFGSDNQLLSNAATMESKEVNDKCEMNVISGGTAINTTIDSNGSMCISSGGTANSTTVNSGGYLYVSWGGTATEILENGGCVGVEADAEATFVSNTITGLVLKGRSATVHSGTTANSTIIQNGSICVFSGGSAADTYLSGGKMTISSGGTANHTIVYSKGRIEVARDGTANNIIVNSLGSLCVNAGGTATNIVWTPYEGVLEIREGAVVTFSSECSGVYYGVNNQLISHAAAMDNSELGDKYEIHVMFGGTVNNTIVNSEGKLKIYSGGTANSTTVKPYGWAYVSGGGVANDTIMDYGGEFHISSGGTANNTRIMAWGSMFVSSGTANSTTINSGGKLVVNGGTINNTTINRDAQISINSGTANLTTINGETGLGLSINRNGTANLTTINSGGRFSIGGVANSTTVNYGGKFTVSRGGTANFTTVNSGGEFQISSGGVAKNITINQGAKINVSKGGTLTGRIVRFGDRISMANGSIFDFDLRQIAPGAGARINDLAGLSGTPDWTITVNAGQADGIYSLVGNAAKFNQTISVVNETGDELGTLTVGTTTVISDTDYTLFLSDDGMLSLKIGESLSPSTYTSVGLVLSGGSASVESGEVFYDTLVGPGGEFRVNDGGMADATIVSGGKFMINGSGAAESTMVDSGGKFEINRGGTATDTGIMFGGMFTVGDGGVAVNTEVNFGGNLAVTAKGSATNTTVDSGGSSIISSGGTANGAAVSSDGCLIVSSGGKLTGRMAFENGAVVSASVGAFFDFDLRQTAPDECALANDILIIQGTPFYTITVDGMQASGTYRLAEGITIFSNAISVMNTSGEQLGSLLVSQKLETEYADYTLKVTNGCLTVTVDNAASVPPDADTEAPAAPAGLMPVVDGQNVALLWNESTDDTGVKEYIVKYSHDGEIFTARTTIPHYVLNNADYGTWSWSVQAVDFAGNESAVTVGDAFTVSEFKPYTVEYSKDNFEHTIRFTVSSPTLNSFRMPGGAYQMRVMAANSGEWMEGDPIEAETFGDTPQLVKSDADGNADVFFAHAVGAWESAYLAHHTGSVNDWRGTNEYAMLYGKNRFADIFEGSDDANILLLTDGDNGDALFVDDIYSASPDKLGLSQARIARIDEIRAGSGDDIVDMTSRKFEYIGDGLTIRGGEGDDVIWANKGDNMLFGDAGNDRIVGASGDDVIAGGIGNDRMHGGGGDDVFTFCDNWGTDNVEQRADGFVTLWFASGSESNWNAETLTYTDGENSIKVSGVAAEQVALKFGDDGSAQFAALNSAGAFFDATSERIFEESGKGMLASL